jgi:hypothetical protein
MRQPRSILLLGVVFGIAVATAARADGELELVVAQADVPIAAGAFADVQVTVINRTAETMSGSVLRIGPSYRYEQLSEPDCGPLVPEIMTPDHLRSTLAPIAAGGQHTCVIRVHRDAEMAESPVAIWSVFPGDSLDWPSDGKILRFGTFADIRLSATLTSRSVSDASIRSVVRVTAHNASSIALTTESTLEPCLVARPQRVIAGACALSGNVCGLGDRDFLRWPPLAPGATVQCDLESSVPLSVDTWSPEFFLDEASVSTTGEYVHPSLGEVPRIAFPVTHAHVELDQAGIGGTWASAATPAQGFVLDVSPHFHGEGRALLFGGWFTYAAAAGSPQRWFTLQGEVGGIEGEVGLYYSSGGAFDATQPATTTRVGRAEVRFADCNHGQITYRGDPPYQHGLVFGTIPLTRLLPTASCSTNGAANTSPPRSALAGIWADLSSSAQGLVVDVDPAQRLLFAGWFTYPASGTDPQRWYTLQGTLDASAPSGSGIGLYESTGGAFNGPAPASTVRVGDADITLLNCTNATMSYRFTSGENAGLDGTLDLSRLGSAPASCEP